MEEGQDDREHHIFVNNLDAYITKNIGKYLSKQIPGISDEGEPEEDLAEDKLNEPDGPPAPKKNTYIVSGTLKHPKSQKPKFARDILNYDKRSRFFEHLMRHDVVVYDVTDDPEQANEALWVAQQMEQNYEKFQTQKIFILISNLMTWTATKPNDPDDPVFMEAEYRRRKPHPNYKELFDLEKEIIRLGKAHKKKFTTYVLACGLFYGCDEDIFLHFFRRAWITQSPLPVYGQGQNVLPTIHVLDLASAIQSIADNPPRQRYIVVKDESNNTLGEIVQAISAQLSTGQVVHVTDDEGTKEERIPDSTYNLLTTDLHIEPSALREEMQVRWVCETGMVDNMPRLVHEFIEAHDLKPLRICILGPPGVGKSALAKELSKLYRLHHIHLKALIFETYKNLMEPIKAMDHLIEMRKAEREAAEAEEQARIREMEARLAAEAGEEQQPEGGPDADTRLSQGSAEKRKISEVTVQRTALEGTTIDTTEYEEYKFTLTADEVPSIRKSSYNETVADMEYYPLDPAPVWKSEDELEMMVTDAQEQLDNLHDNTDENGRLNDETLIRLLIQKLLTRPCQNQGFVLDGFPKTLQQAELLFRPDPDDEEALADSKHPGSHRLITPHLVIMMEGSNDFVLHRMCQQAESYGIDPAQARVMPPPWPPGFKVEKPEEHITESAGMHEEATSEEHVQAEHGQATITFEDDTGKQYETLETHQNRFDRRLQNYRGYMAPAAAAARLALIRSIERIALEEFETEEEKIKLTAEAMAEETEGQEEHALPEELTAPADSVDITAAREALEASYKANLTSRLAAVPPLPEIPEDTEENVLTYFDIREIHPLCLDMDKDFSPFVESGATRENCLERIRKAIGRPTAVPLPFSDAVPASPMDSEMTEKITRRLENIRSKKYITAEAEKTQQAMADEVLLAKQQEEWDGWLELVRAQNYECAQAQALPMRHYLMKYVMPDLTKALVSCSAIRPDDPIDYVAEYLLKSGCEQ
ncbi:unnamed protein product [Calicophoron daubneyi]|uniref:Adenylate kinase 7 n=1 Tax=Calicophoron daubneyi TaxID=300641 RepID=A0AAV2TVF1_CALDB